MMASTSTSTNHGGTGGSGGGFRDYVLRQNSSSLSNSSGAVDVAVGGGGSHPRGSSTASRGGIHNSHSHHSPHDAGGFNPHPSHHQHHQHQQQQHLRSSGGSAYPNFASYRHHGGGAAQSSASTSTSHAHPHAHTITDEDRSPSLLSSHSRYSNYNNSNASGSFDEHNSQPQQQQHYGQQHPQQHQYRQQNSSSFASQQSYRDGNHGNSDNVCWSDLKPPAAAAVSSSFTGSEPMAQEKEEILDQYRELALYETADKCVRATGYNPLKRNSTNSHHSIHTTFYSELTEEKMTLQRPARARCSTHKALVPVPDKLVVPPRVVPHIRISSTSSSNSNSTNNAQILQNLYNHHNHNRNTHAHDPPATRCTFLAAVEANLNSNPDTSDSDVIVCTECETTLHVSSSDRRGLGILCCPQCLRLSAHTSISTSVVVPVPVPVC